MANKSCGDLDHERNTGDGGKMTIFGIYVLNKNKENVMMD